MADRVYIADYIKKKRRRKGRYEFLVKWKGYSSKPHLKEYSIFCLLTSKLEDDYLDVLLNTVGIVHDGMDNEYEVYGQILPRFRDCTWEPEENILDFSLIQQFEDEGYDPRRVRRARTKKRRKSEISESRPISHRFLCGIEDPDSDSGNDRDYPNDKIATSFTESPFTSPRYSHLWRRKNEPDTNKPTSPVNDPDNSDSDRDGNQHMKNGGKSCHPKMRAKFMFRTGDLETYDWGYDWSSSDNESPKEKLEDEKCVEIKDIESNNVLSNSRCFSLKRRWTNSFDEESLHSEATIPAIDDHDAPVKRAKLDDDELALSDMESCTTEMNFALENCDVIDDVIENGVCDSKDLKTEEGNTSIKQDEEILVTEVTHNLVTITILESNTEKGFFKEWTDG